MAYQRRDIRGGAVVTSLASGINSGDATFTLAAVTGWPDGVPGDFFVVIDRDTASEEVIRCASRTGTTVTVQTSGRGSDGTSAAAHSSGAPVEHCSTALDDDEANYAVNKTVGKITTAGDILVGDAASSLVRLGNGTTGLPLVAGASTPSYTALGTSGIADDAVTGAKIVADAIGASEIAAGAVGTSELADQGVTTAKLLDLGVTTGKIALLAVDSTLLAAAAVTPTKLASSVVDDSTIQFNSGVLRIKDAGVTQAKVAAGQRHVYQSAAASPPSSPNVGDVWEQTDTFMVLHYQGATTGWTPPWNLPWGFQATPTTMASNSTGITTLADVSPALTIVLPSTHPANRNIRVQVHTAFRAVGAASQANALIREGSTTLATATVILSANTQASTVIVQADITPTTGAHTYKFSASANTLVDVPGAAIQPAIMTVQDMGPSANPA